MCQSHRLQELRERFHSATNAGAFLAAYCAVQHCTADELTEADHASIILDAEHAARGGLIPAYAVSYCNGPVNFDDRPD